MKFWSKKSDKINRALHRDLGYLFIGLTLIYGLSGIAVILRYLDVDIAHSETKIERVLDANLSKEQLNAYWMSKKSELPKLSKIRTTDNVSEEFIIRVKGGEGVYAPQTGALSVTVYKTNKLVKFVNDIHYNVGGRFTWLGLVYAFMLVFFAISGAIIVKGRKGFMRRGIWFMSIGLLIPILMYFLF